jgi:hypothetical protein
MRYILGAFSDVKFVKEGDRLVYIYHRGGGPELTGETHHRVEGGLG